MSWSLPANAPLLLSALAAGAGGIGWARLLARPNDRTSIIGSVLYNHDLQRYRRHALKAGMDPQAAYEEAVKLAAEKWSEPRKKRARASY